MNPSIEPFITTHDASLLHSLAYQAKGGRDSIVDQVVDLLDDVQIVDVLPGPRVGIGGDVRYIEGTSGAMRAVTLTLPAQADPAQHRISVLSPVGRALFGRAPSDLVRVELPGARVAQLVIIEVTPHAEEELSAEMED